MGQQEEKIKVEGEETEEVHEKKIEEEKKITKLESKVKEYEDLVRALLTLIILEKGLSKKKKP